MTSLDLIPILVGSTPCCRRTFKIELDPITLGAIRIGLYKAACKGCGQIFSISLTPQQERLVTKFNEEKAAPDVVDVDFTPLWDYCLLEELPPPETKTEGGLLLPNNVKIQDLGKCRVIKAGPGVYKDNGTFVPNPLKPGDLIYRMTLMKAFHVIIKGKQYLCSAGRDIVATASTED